MLLVVDLLGLDSQVSRLCERLGQHRCLHLVLFIFLSFIVVINVLIQALRSTRFIKFAAEYHLRHHNSQRVTIRVDLIVDRNEQAWIGKDSLRVLLIILVRDQVLRCMEDFKHLLLCHTSSFYVLRRQQLTTTRECHILTFLGLAFFRVGCGSILHRLILLRLLFAFSLVLRSL